MGLKPRKKPAAAPAKPAKRTPRAKPKRTSEAKAKAARANGAKGGRPKKHVYEQLFTAVEDPAKVEDPLQLVPWVMRALAIALRETLQGRGSTALNAELRSTARVIKSMVPMERLRQAEAAVRGESKRATGKLSKPKGQRVTAAPTGSKPIR
jgi:hypothetical protein